MINFQRKIDYNRLNEIIRLFAKYKFHNLLGESKLKGSFWRGLFKRYDADIDLDASAPERLRMVFEELGPTFVKLGQMLSTRPDLVGHKMADEFAKLQDDAKPFDFKIVKSTIEKELGKPLDLLFSNFNSEPVAAASIGQVHRAFLIDGTEVAIKIQRPGIQEIVDKDLVIMHHMAGLINKTIPSMRIFNIPVIVDEFEKSITKEMDYQLEARNTQNFGANFANDEGIYVPRIFSDYSTSLVLTMEFMHGNKMVNVLDNPDGFDDKLLAKRVAKSYFKQILEDGFFHADPHPGNMYVLENNVLCYIDFGMMGHIDNEFMANLGELFMHAIDYNADAVINQLIYMHIIDQTVDRQLLKRDIMDVFDRYYGASLQEMRLGNIMKDLAIPLIYKYQTHIPPEFTLIIRSVSLIEGVAYSLDPEFDATNVLKPMVKKILLKKISPENIVEFFKENMFELEHLVKNLPRHVNLLMGKIEESEIKIKYSEEFSDNLERISNKIVVAIIIAALLLGSSWIIQIDKGPMIFEMPILGFLGFAASGILGLGLIIYIVRFKNI
ncbi:MAG: protein kinase [Methanobacterium sp. BRmetb2]|jgi:ubiquinone biosynthesis protein|nr:MAG: protein kinase [Methanobacterium sp. BRmetb2]